MVAELELVIPSLVCEGCAEAISSVLNSLPGIRQVSVQVPKKRARVLFDSSQVEALRIVEALEKAGFAAIGA